MQPTPELLRKCLVVLLQITWMSGCGPARESNDPTHVILISLDTLRRDHVGVYGPSDENSTPNLDDLARSGVIFENAFSPVPFTLPSHMSMLTGLHPEVHAVHGSRAKLSSRVTTLTETLSTAGYRTLGLVSNLWMKGGFGFARDFDHYERLAYGLTYSDRINQRLFELLDQQEVDDAPYFLFLHYIDPHSDSFRVADNTLPYFAPAQYLEKTGVVADTREFCDESDNCATDYLLAVNREGRSVSASELNKLKALYRSGIEYLDGDLGELFEGLKTRGLWEDALVVLTADHGEEFLEHGEFIHSQPYVENLAVPLLIRLPDDQFAGVRVADTAQLMDLLPTILDWRGLAHPDPVQGRSLLPLSRGERLPRLVALGRDKKSSHRFALRTESYTLIHDLAAGTSELYDRLVDPAELVDLHTQNPDVVDRLLAGLESLVSENSEAARRVAGDSQGKSILNKEEEEKLRAIGYLD